MNISQIKVELAINEEAIKNASTDELQALLTQRATLKDLLIEALSDALAKGAKYEQ